MSHTSFQEEHRIKPPHSDGAEVPEASNALEPNPGDETPPGERRGRFGATEPPARVEHIVGSWPNEPRTAARQLMKECGPPQAFSETELVWFHADGTRTLLSHGQSPRRDKQG